MPIKVFGSTPENVESKIHALFLHINPIQQLIKKKAISKKTLIWKNNLEIKIFGTQLASDNQLQKILLI